MLVDSAFVCIIRNCLGEVEVSTTTLSEVVVNCILHRFYAADSPLRIFIFDNRIEIHSPGLLPQGITVEDATHGVSVSRNKLLFSNGIHLLPYTGAGSGLTRAQLYTSNIKFENDERLKEFVVTIWRESDEVGVEGEKHSDRIPYAKLPGVQKNIIQYCSIPRSAREILA